MNNESDTLYLRDDIYFCTGCRRFHDMETNEIVHVPGIDYYTDPDTGKGYKVRQPKSKKIKTTKGFGNPNLN